jgi:hypothetical protein
MLVFFDDDNLWVCWFDDDGRHQNTEVVPHQLGDRAQAYWQRVKYPALEALLRSRFGYRAGTIHVRPFNDPVSGAAIKAGPGSLEQFIRSPKGDWPKWMQKQRRQAEAKRVLEWIQKGDRYVLRARGPEYPIDIGDGRCAGGSLS